jgi:membrane associated rhomboid family serine protease
MGIYDRDYFHEERRGLFLGAPRTMVITLVLVTVVLYLVDVLANGVLTDALSLKSDLFRRPWQAWQLVTYGFAHDPGGVWHIAGNMLVLWFFGRELELLYGRREFLSLYLTLLIVAGLCWVAFETFVMRTPGPRPVQLIGASGAVAGVAVLFCIHYPTRIIYIWGVLPVPVWALVGLYLVGDFISLRAAARGDGPGFVAYAAHLGGAAYGGLYYKTRWSLLKLLPGGGRLDWRRLRPKLGQPQLRVHEPDEEDQPPDLSARVDAILEKISRQGESSLTPEERQTLEDASRRYQQRRR